LHRRRVMDALDRFRGDPPVGVGRGGGEHASTGAHSSHA
jgi:hypothetical protein